MFRMKDKHKAILVLVAAIVANVHQVTKLLVKIFDDSVMDLTEAVELAQEGKSIYGDWASKDTPEDLAPG